MTGAGHSRPASAGDPVVDRDAAARGTIYGTLSSFFDEPDENCYAGLQDGSFHDDLSILMDASGLEVSVPPLATEDDLDLLRARFNDVFAVGYPDPAVPLYESDHVESGDWDDVNLDLARAYDYFGVEVDQSRREHHDHLVLELEFAGYLARLAAATGEDDLRRARRDFLDRHLVPFLESVARETEREVETGVYDEVTSFAAEFAVADRADLRTRLTESSEVDPS